MQKAQTLPELTLMTKGRYRAGLARTADETAQAQALRTLAFGTDATDRDDFDRHCVHMLIRDRTSGDLVCCFRILLFDGGGGLDRSYSAQFYELSGLKTFPGRMLEMGRFCIHPNWHDPDILRVAWGALTVFVDEHGVGFLFGCSSFAGTRTENYLDAFAMLRAHHLAPKRWQPRIKAPDVFRFAARLRRQPDPKKAMARMPPLLRTYLMMGGRVSDHAVVDHHMNTLHVFTGLEISAIPDARKRLLRAVAGQGRVQAVDAPAQPV